jgi:hypothetical protein
MELVDDRGSVDGLGAEPDGVADLEVTELCLAVLVDVAGRVTP